MLKKYQSITIEQVAYHEAGHVMYYLLRGIVPECVEVVDENQGTTYVDSEEETLSALTQDFSLLAGTVAQHIYAGDFSSTLQQVQAGGVPDGASSDFSKLTESDAGVIAEMMLHLYDLFCCERWLILSTIAEELILKRALSKKQIAEIVVRLARINKNMKRIAKFRRNSMVLSTDEHYRSRLRRCRRKI